LAKLKKIVFLSVVVCCFVQLPLTINAFASGSAIDARHAGTEVDLFLLPKKITNAQQRTVSRQLVPKRITAVEVRSVAPCYYIGYFCCAFAFLQLRIFVIRI